MNEQDVTYQYTLFDVVLVALICAIVASLAIPTYAEYKDSVRFAEVHEAAAEARKAIERAAADTSTDSLESLDSGTYGIPPLVRRSAEQHGLTVMNGEITVIWKDDGSRLAGETFVLTANGLLPPVQWTVSGSCVAAELC